MIFVSFFSIMKGDDSMKYFKRVEGDRLYLSPMCLEDVETYVKWMNDDNVILGLNGGKGMANVESEREWILANLRNNREQFAIVRKSDDKLIGNCGFNNLDINNGIGTVGIFIGEEKDRNKGYGSEALKLLLSYGFRNMNLHVIRLSVYSFNKNAIKCYEKAGFKKAGKIREACLINGKRYDEIIMDILKKEFDKDG